MVSVFYVVPHVPTEARRRFVLDLRRQLPNLHVVPDPGKRGAWPTLRDGLLFAYRKSRDTHVTVLNDDLVLCRGFNRLLHEAVNVRADHFVQPFSMTKRQREAHLRGDAWFTSTDLVYGAGITFPLRHVGRLVRDVDDSFDPAYRSADVRIAWWLRKESLGPIWHTAPSLLEHALSHDSAIGHSISGRVASVFYPEPTVDFSIIPDAPLHYGAVSRTRGIEKHIRTERTP